MCKKIVYFMVVLLFLPIISYGSKEGYSNRYESLDLDSVLSNERILRNYINCFLEKGPCSAEARDYKKDIPHFMQSKCADCSDVQRKVVLRSSKFLMEKKPTEWASLLDKYDPSREFEKFLIEQLRKTK